MTTRALAQNSGPLNDDDAASGSYSLEVEGGDTIYGCRKYEQG